MRDPFASEVHSIPFPLQIWSKYQKIKTIRKNFNQDKEIPEG